MTLAVANGIVGGLVGGFVSGFAGTLLNGGSLGDAFKAGVIGGAIGEVTGGLAGKIGDVLGHEVGSFTKELKRATAHGIVSGGASELQGDSFMSGFAAGFAGSAAGSYTMSKIKGDGWRQVAKRTTVSALAGGTASAIGGGKFANGAFTAGIQHLFNAEGKLALRKLIGHLDNPDEDQQIIKARRRDGPYETEVECVKAADGALREASRYEGSEWDSLVVTSSVDGRVEYYYIQPWTAGKWNSVWIPDKDYMPESTVAVVHNHPQNIPYSSPDLEAADIYLIRSYLSLPDSRILVYQGRKQGGLRRWWISLTNDYEEIKN